jgi:DNA-directed RNA polymerase beta subunit
MLPHVSIAPYNETKKAYFIGYIVHKLLMSSIGARRPDDRDHYAQKRLDLVRLPSHKRKDAFHKYTPCLFHKYALASAQTPHVLDWRTEAR